MAIIKARDLKVGMDLGNWGSVVEVSEVINGRVEVTFSAHDYDCGEDEYYPCDLDAEEILNY